MKLQLTRPEVAGVLRLKNSEAVDRLVQRGVLTVAAHTPRGHPLFSVDDVLRAARRVLPPKGVEPEPRALDSEAMP